MRVSVQVLKSGRYRNTVYSLRRLGAIVLFLFLLFSLLLTVLLFQQKRDLVLYPKGVSWKINNMWGNYPNTNWTGVEWDAQDLQNAGVTWARTNLDQNVPFAYYDHVVQIARAHDIHLMPLVYKSDPPDDLGTPAQQQAYIAWLGQAVDRYKNYIHYWEIQNEEDEP